MNSLQELINQALVKKEKRIRSHKFSPSSLGRCYRAQFWNRKDEPQSNPVDERTLRIFKAGDLFHNFVQDVLIANNSEVKKEVLVENEDFKGYADLVINGEVMDIKSQHSRAFHYRIKKEWKELEEKLFCNILQVVFYAVMLGKEKARLVFISKDDLCIQEYPLTVSNYKSSLEEEIKQLRGFWEAGVLPPAQPRAYPNEKGEFSECKYCSWADKCKEMENKKEVKNGFKGSETNKQDN